MTLIDTAEIYADGASETLVGEALAGRREEAFSSPRSRRPMPAERGTVKACEASLKRLGTDRLDLYLLHWRGRFRWRRRWRPSSASSRPARSAPGASRTSTPTTWRSFSPCPAASAARPTRSSTIPTSAAPSSTSCPCCPIARIPAMAYSPIGQGGALLRHPALDRIARRHHATPAQIALAFALEGDEMIAIPKAGTVAHALENAQGCGDRADAAGLPRARRGLSAAAAQAAPCGDLTAPPSAPVPVERGPPTGAGRRTGYGAT